MAASGFQCSRCLVAVLGALLMLAPSVRAQSSSSSQPPSAPPAGSSQSAASAPAYAQEKAPSLIDPAGPTISLISAEPVFIMAAALNACGYNYGLEVSDPIRKRVRDEIDQALIQSADARTKRDALCLFIAQHNMTGTAKDVAQYVSLSLYLTPPPQLEATASLTEMPPDATQVYEVLPLLRSFAQAVDLHGIWLTTHRYYDDEIDKLHDSLSQMIVDTNTYLRMPASSYDGRRFIVIVEPMLSPGTVNARVYGTDYIVVVSPVNGKIRMNDVRHVYLHYVIDPLLYARSNAIDRMSPIMKLVRDAPIDFRLRNDPVPLSVECLIKAIEARLMDTGIAPYKIPAGVDRSALPKYEYQREETEKKMEDVRRVAVARDMTQGYVLTQYFYEQMIQFEHQEASLKDSIGEMVYGMDVDAEAHRIKRIVFDTQADTDVLARSAPRRLQGMDLAEFKLSQGDTADAAALAGKVLAHPADTAQAEADVAHAHFILARVNLMTGHPQQAYDEFEKTLATGKQQRLLAWSHIYLGRMLDLECRRGAALEQYKQALIVRDGQQDTRLAAERGVKAAYTVPGQPACDDTSDGDGPEPDAKTPAQNAAQKQQ